MKSTAKNKKVEHTRTSRDIITCENSIYFRYYDETENNIAVPSTLVAISTILTDLLL